MKRGSEWLSQGAELLAAQEDAQQPPCFDVLIVGSGYGGAVAAARVAEWALKEGKALTIAVVERGLEYLPGDFPKTLDELTGHVRFSGGGRAGIRGWRDGLFDVRLGNDVSALIANGLGGGSLINAGVAERADVPSLADPAWPAPWCANEAKWNELYTRAERQLAAQPWQPIGVPKEAAMHKLGERLGAKKEHVRPVRLTIQPSKQDDNHASPPLRGCIGCGDCFSGCNVGAKRTLGTTYLKRARDTDVAIYTGATVLKVERGSDDWPWVVRWVFSDAKRLPARDVPYSIKARRVVLAAGTFGSTEILLRSQAPGLRFSAQLGAGFSTNGDVIGAQYRLPEYVGAWAKDDVPREERHVGPTITHQVELDRDDRKTPAKRLVVQDLAVPGSLGWLFGELLTSLMVPQRWTRFDWRRRGPDSPDPAMVNDADKGDLSRTLLLSAFSHDGAAGRLHTLPGFDEALHDGNVVVHWPGAGDAECFECTDQRLLAATGKTDAFWLRNPLWQAVPDSPLLDQPTNRQVLTVHPLGGCRMAHTMKDGAVDPFGRVFDSGGLDDGGAAGRRGAEWAAREDRRIHDGLFVLDGSIVPTSLGINPLLTITALAEGIVDEWLIDWPQAKRPLARRAAGPTPLAAWPVTFPTPEAWPVQASTAAVPTVATNLSFTERMVGLLDTRLQPEDPDDDHFRLSVKFAFQEVKNIQAFVRKRDKSLTFNGEIQLVCSWWDPVKGRQADRRAPDPVAIAGQVKWFTQQPISVIARMWRTFCGWRQLRAAADLPDIERDGTEVSSIFLRPHDWGAFLRKIVAFLKMLTHFGAPRLLEYRFGPLEQALTATTQGGKTFTLPKGTVLTGVKSLVYEPGGNPWVQLTEMPLRCESPEPGGTQELATLNYDEVFMLGRDELPLMLTHQRDGVTGLRDALSLLLYTGRVIFQQHFLSFRKPDYALRRALRRLPWQDATTRYPHLEFCSFDDVLVRNPAAGGGDIRLRLTRIRKSATPAGGHGDPVLLLHGFGSGGIQFTHEAMRAPMAQWLADQGREVWVGELRTSIGLPTCEQQWVMDDIALEDIPALVDAVEHKRAQYAGPSADRRIDVVAHCIGSAMFCMAALAGKLDGKIRRAVLMQVGPIIHLPRGNRMRGYLGNRAQKLFGFGLVKSTVSDDASDAEVALDRVLATFPYLGGIDQERWRERVRASHARLALCSDLRHNGRLVNTMRSAGVFAQLFQWDNLYAQDQALDNQPLLDALPDLLGPCNLTTYQQTVQYAFLRRLTNQDGENMYVTDEGVRAHLAFPILFVQGMLNDVFAPRGTHESQRLLKRIFGDSHPVGRIEVPAFGHLDCVVGLDAERQVFSKMLPFLNEERLPVTSTFKQDGADFRAPSIGPWIGDAQWQEGDVLRLRVGLKVDEQRTPPSHIYSVLVVNGEPVPGSLTAHLTPVARIMRGVSGARLVCALAFWPEGEAVLQVDVPASLHSGGNRSFEVWVCTLDGMQPDESADEFVTRWKERRLERPARAPRSDIELPIDHLLIDSEWLSASHPKPKAGDISFAVVACRQAPLLVDRQITDKAFEHLAQHLGPVHHVLMVGDQVYADSLAASGGVDGTRLRFFDAHREAWTAPHQRDVMCRRPVYMAVDDHEFRDDHNNATRLKHLREWGASLDAMWRYQYAAGPLGIDMAQRHDGKFWYEMRNAGFHTFVCDTRNRRFEGARVDCKWAKIMHDSQFAAIKKWLVRSKESKRARFLVVPSPVAPVFRITVERPEYRLRCDDWQRYPESLSKLFELLIEDGAERLVLLSGDYHSFVDCELRVTETGNHPTSITCRSITTSGAYRPYEFANTDREELWEPPKAQPEAELELTFDRYRYRFTYRITDFVAGPGYTRIATDGNNPVKVDFVVVPEADSKAHRAASPVPPSAPIPAPAPSVAIPA